MPVTVAFDGQRMLSRGMSHAMSKNDDEAVEITPPGETNPVTVRRDADGNLVLMVERSSAHRAIAKALGVGHLERERAEAEIIATPTDAVGEVRAQEEQPK